MERREFAYRGPFNRKARGNILLSAAIAAFFIWMLSLGTPIRDTKTGSYLLPADRLYLEVLFFAISAFLVQLVLHDWIRRRKCKILIESNEIIWINERGIEKIRTSMDHAECRTSIAKGPLNFRFTPRWDIVTPVGTISLASDYDNFSNLKAGIDAQKKSASIQGQQTRAKFERPPRKRKN